MHMRNLFWEQLVQLKLTDDETRLVGKTLAKIHIKGN